MAEEKKTGEKKHITGARIAKEIRQYKKVSTLNAPNLGAVSLAKATICLTFLKLDTILRRIFEKGEHRSMRK